MEQQVVEPNFQKAPKARARDSGGHDHSHTPTNQPTQIDGPLSLIAPSLSFLVHFPKHLLQIKLERENAKKTRSPWPTLASATLDLRRFFEEMEAQQGEVVTAFELALVVPKRDAPLACDGDTRDCVEFLVQQLRNAGLVVERVQGLSEEFLKVVLSLSLFLFFLFARPLVLGAAFLCSNAGLRKCCLIV